jgi:hypothetical protein
MQHGYQSARREFHRLRATCLRLIQREYLPGLQNAVGVGFRRP